jgi:fibronectin type 3 domain-containing protein
MKLIKSILKTVLILLASFSFLNAFFSDISLPTIKGVKKVVDESSVGFEWPSLAKFSNVGGINVYRAKAKPGINQTYVKIASIPNRFATHFVDTTIEPNTNYFYTFTTFSGLNESSHGQIIAVKTKPKYKAVKLVSAEVVGKDTVKVLWVPHSNVRIYKYILQRSKDNSKFFYLDTIKGRLYPEFIDTTAKRGHKYSYRIVALDAYGKASEVSQIVSVEVAP